MFGNASYAMLGECLARRPYADDLQDGLLQDTEGGEPIEETAILFFPPIFPFFFQLSHRICT